MTEAQKARMFDMMTHVFDIVEEKETMIRHISQEKHELLHHVQRLHDTDRWLSELQVSTQDSHEHTSYVRFVEMNILDEGLQERLIELLQAVESRFLNRIGEIREQMQIPCSDDQLETLF